VIELDKTLVIVFYSEGGKTKRMAEHIAEGARLPGVNVKLKRAEDCSISDLVEADGIAVGSPTYFSNMAWQVKKLVDESISAYEMPHSLENKIGACFTSAGTRRDGLKCIKMLEVALGFHHKMKLIPSIVSDSNDDEKQLLRTCQQYGKTLAEQLR